MGDKIAHEIFESCGFTNFLFEIVESFDYTFMSPDD